MKIQPLISSADIDMCLRRDEAAIPFRILSPRRECQLLSCIKSGLSEPPRSALGRLRKSSSGLRSSPRPYRMSPTCRCSAFRSHCARCRCLSAISNRSATTSDAFARFQMALQRVKTPLRELDLSLLQPKLTLWQITGASQDAKLSLLQKSPHCTNFDLHCARRRCHCYRSSPYCLRRDDRCR